MARQSRNMKRTSLFLSVNMIDAVAKMSLRKNITGADYIRAAIRDRILEDVEKLKGK